MTQTKFENGTATAEEMLSKAGLAWSAEEHPLLTAGGVDIPSHKAIVRSDNKAPIGIVGKDYGVVQNVEAFSMFDIVAREKGGTFADVKTFDGGTKVVATMELPFKASDFVRGVDDVIRREIRLINSFDGSTGFVGQCNAIVLVCTNGMTTAKKESGFMLRHTKNVKDRYQKALSIWAGCDRYFDELISRSQRLAKEIFTKEDLTKYVRHLFPADKKTKEYSTRAINQQAMVMNLFFQGMGNAGKNAFDAYNALTEYLDHKRFAGDEDKAGASNVFGTGAKMRENAFAYLEGQLR